MLNKLQSAEFFDVVKDRMWISRGQNTLYNPFRVVIPADILEIACYARAHANWEIF